MTTEQRVTLTPTNASEADAIICYTYASKEDIVEAFRTALRDDQIRCVTLDGVNGTTIIPSAIYRSHVIHVK